jgi:hypothetical protein
VGSVSVKEETLAKQGEIPVKQEEDDYNHSGNFYIQATNIRLDRVRFLIGRRIRPNWSMIYVRFGPF